MLQNAGDSFATWQRFTSPHTALTCIFIRPTGLANWPQMMRSAEFATTLTGARESLILEMNRRIHFTQSNELR
jgi:hypothetical protein